MKDETLDLGNMTVEDLFKAKAERRQRLTNLPFEQKIEIVKRLQLRSFFDRSIEACLKEPLHDLDEKDPNAYERITFVSERGPGALRVPGESSRFEEV